MASPIFPAIALDLGTTAIKAGLLDGEGNLCSIVAQPAPVITASGGRYESDALAYALVAERVLGECLSHVQNVPPLGLCSQRSSFLVWERATGLPISPLISWQDIRGTASCDALRDSEGLIRELTGLRLTPYYFAPKLRVVFQEHPDWRVRLEQGELLVGTLDSFLVWRWTGGKHHVTDASMAARTLLMDVRQQQWSPALCELFGIPLSILPGIIPSAGLNLEITHVFPNFKSKTFCRSGSARQLFPAGIARPTEEAFEPVLKFVLQASMGDQSAALIASAGSRSADVLVNLGTGGFALRYLEAEDGAGCLRGLGRGESQSFHPHLNPPPQGGGGYAPSPLRGKAGMGVESPASLLTRGGRGSEDAEGINAAQDGYLRTLVYLDSQPHIAIEGTLNSLAAALAPFPVGDCRIEDFAQDDIFCIAEPSGLGAPYFRNDLGIRFSAVVDHLSPHQVGCLLLEGIVFRVARILEDFQGASPIGRVFLSGGLSELVCLQQGIALCAPCIVLRLRQKESSLQGAAILAAGRVDSPRSDAEEVQVSRLDGALQEKYSRWKVWFDALLVS